MNTVQSTLVYIWRKEGISITKNKEKKVRIESNRWIGNFADYVQTWA